jgi:hypothetical protein
LNGTENYTVLNDTLKELFEQETSVCTYYDFRDDTFYNITSKKLYDLAGNQEQYPIRITFARPNMVELIHFKLTT